MSEPTRRPRSAGPARGSPRQPDDRAERDLRALLDGSAGSPTQVEPPVLRPGRPRTSASVLVTVLVAAALLVLTTAVVSGMPARPPASTPHSLPVSRAATVPPSTLQCRPSWVYPIPCGTFRSTYGGAAVRGAGGGPSQEPLEISLTRRAGVLLLSASDGGCWTATVPMRVVRAAAPAPIEQRAVERAGEPVFDTTACTDAGAPRLSWAYSFLHTTLRTVDAQTFGRNDSSVFFEYQGSAAIGQPQIPRTDTECLPAHVEPFDCGTYRSVSGTGRLAFLGSRPYRLSFQHVNGELTAGLHGRCNGLSAALQADGDSVVATGGGATAMLCLGLRGRDDDAVQAFFHGVLTWTARGDRIVFSSSSASATFER